MSSPRGSARPIFGARCYIQNAASHKDPATEGYRRLSRFADDVWELQEDSLIKLYKVVRYKEMYTSCSSARCCLYIAIFDQIALFNFSSHLFTPT